MKNYFCKSYGQARACGDCRHNPMNQAGQAKGPPIAPTIRKDLTCAHWSAIPHHLTPKEPGNG